MTERVKVARLAFVSLGFAAGIAVASLAPSIPQTVRKLTGLAFGSGAVQSPDNAPQPRGGGSEVPDDKQAVVSLTDEQLTEAHIDLAQVEGGILAHRIIVPGTIIPVADRIARVAVKLSGTVAELRKNIGDPVIKGEVLAILESREVADAKSEYLAARLANELQQTLFQRDKMVWEGHASTEQQFLRSRTLTAQTEMKFNISRQKLFALGLNESEIAALPNEPEALLRRQEVRAPMAGRVVERKVDLGMAVGRDNLTRLRLRPTRRVDFVAPIAGS